MDVNRTRFKGQLLSILGAIAESHFVAIDLELSGIPTRQDHRGRQTLQDRYHELREAADTYTVLQVGLTCVKQDTMGAKYILKPYNFNINPCIEEKGLGVERKITFHSGAIEFLLSHGFQMQLPFTEGVPYLTRSEEASAWKRGVDRLDRNDIGDMEINEDDPNIADFLSKLRSLVRKWVNTSVITDRLPIYSSAVTARDIKSGQVPDMTRYEKRMVHQIVRNEFPYLTTKGGYHCVEVIHRHTEREKNFRRERLDELSFRCRYQRGFRWIVDALSGSKEMTDIPLHYVAHDAKTGDARMYNSDRVRAQLSSISWEIQRNRPVLVGHNMFMDLVYFYRTFVGELPTTVEEFQHEIHSLFPVVVDTKFLATWDAVDSNQFSSLDELYDVVSSQEAPCIETSPEHAKYEASEAYHEAGYDSYTTACVMVRWSARMEAQVDNYEDLSPGKSVSSPPNPYLDGVYESRVSPIPADPPRMHAGGVSLQPKPLPQATPERKTKNRKGKKTQGRQSQRGSEEGKFSSVNFFQKLRDEAEENTDDDSGMSSGIDDRLGNIGLSQQMGSSSYVEDKSQTAASGGTCAGPTDPFLANASRYQRYSGGLSSEEDATSPHLQHQSRPIQASTREGLPQTPPRRPGGSPRTAPGPRSEASSTRFTPVKASQPRKPAPLMPAWDSSFWQYFGNKLRVFGTKEMVCDLDPARHSRG